MMMSRPDLWNRAIRLSVAVTVVLFVLMWIRPPQRADGTRIKDWIESARGRGKQQGHGYGSTKSGGHRAGDSQQSDCLLPPFADEVVITVKTGASEAHYRIPSQMATSLRCAPHILHFSDMGQTLGNVTIHDALADVPEFLRIANPEFELYREQNERKKNGVFEKPASEATKKKAWDLDKWKNLHILEKSWEMKPGKKWYLHVDADTYVVWPSLLWWLQKLNDSDPQYIGSLTCFSNVKAAHGGSGILLSDKAMKIVMDNKTTVPAWEQDTGNHCCGDEMVARVMNDHHVPMHNAWPIISGEGPFTTAFGPQQWCQPSVTMHHVSTGVFEMIGIFEQGRDKPHMPITYAEIFENLVYERIPNHSKQDWDNAVDHSPEVPHQNFEDCMAECEGNVNCFSCSFDGSTCTLNVNGFKLGVERKPKDGKTWQSWWRKDKIKDWADKNRNCSVVDLAFKDSYVCSPVQ